MKRTIVRSPESELRKPRPQRLSEVAPGEKEQLHSVRKLFFAQIEK
jgi:hypothetical protein